MISQLHTSCKNCIFAEYHNITQTSCELNELDKFKEHNVEILEAYDEEKEFFVINNNKCLKYRTNEWKYANELLEEKIKYIQKEISIHYHAIIFANNNILDIQQTIESLINQTLPPIYITIVRYFESRLAPSTISELINKYNIKWKVMNLSKCYTDNEIVDLIIPFIPVPIYTIFYAGFNVPLNTFEQLNYKIHNDFLQFSILLPNSTNNGLTVLRQLYLAYNGNIGESLQSKLEREECPYLIPITKIISQFPK